MKVRKRKATNAGETRRERGLISCGQLEFEVIERYSIIMWKIKRVTRATG
jgi:hypothetical protein